MRQSIQTGAQFSLQLDLPEFCSLEHQVTLQYFGFLNALQTDNPFLKTHSAKDVNG